LLLQRSLQTACGSCFMEINIPKNETGMVLYRNRQGIPVFLLTTKQQLDFYYLYSVSETGAVTKLGKSRSPKELEVRHDVLSAMK